MVTRQQYLLNLRAIAGAPYIWDTWGPDTFDCSGAVSYCLGLPVKKSAAELYLMYQNNAVLPAQAAPGTLFFFGDGVDHITHVMSVLTHWYNGGMALIGARGGDNTVVTLDFAKEKGALVGVVAGNYWEVRRVAACDPFDGQA
jgi:hypothetical protein